MKLHILYHGIYAILQTQKQSKSQLLKMSDHVIFLLKSFIDFYFCQDEDLNPSQSL